MMSLPNCPKCGSEYTYEDGLNYVCPMCAHEWPINLEVEEEAEAVIKDSVGNILNDGDSATIIKDLKIKGTSSVIKKGTKVKNIRIIEPENGHDIDGKVDGFGQLNLKSEVVKKLNE
ncbi:alkylphosphonate utilization protein [Macrococcoides bohemicum]|uniref:Alkylphosphonate utilization protein n=1 Tax=Macrococcoides bohemicum TaxID=1903056 RepID=A0AAJ4PCN0_9STAP|nr:zinc ribbon domain-containing protein YjdM [Macrococcus bohemicus]QYA43518.1 alkylphosphonate utilization protein [Macrococcus bohemicus]